MKKYLILWVLTLSLLTPSVWALTLDEARTQGRVGETLNGYLVALKNDAETQKLVLDINHARRASYQQLADSNHLPVDEVAKMAGQKLVERARPGEYVQELMANGCVNNRFPTIFTAKCIFIWVISEYEGRIYIRRTGRLFLYCWLVSLFARVTRYDV